MITLEAMVLFRNVDLISEKYELIDMEQTLEVKNRIAEIDKTINLLDKFNTNGTEPKE